MKRIDLRRDGRVSWVVVCSGPLDLVSFIRTRYVRGNREQGADFLGGHCTSSRTFLRTLIRHSSSAGLARETHTNWAHSRSATTVRTGFLGVVAIFPALSRATWRAVARVWRGFGGGWHQPSLWSTETAGKQGKSVRRMGDEMPMTTHVLRIQPVVQLFEITFWPAEGQVPGGT